MNEFTQLQQRLDAALERIEAGLAGLEPPRPEPEPAEVEGPKPEELQAELEEERAVNATLEARVLAIKERQETRVAALERDLADARRALGVLEPDRHRLKQVIDALRRSNTALREANRAGMAEPGLIDEAMRTELEALRAERDSDRAELEALLGALAPLITKEKEAPADA
ncbi:hypothetical protein [Profundibacterium mesophilum]|nr:hypothetical protein [Profundibacterium mesophilum]